MKMKHQFKIIIAVLAGIVAWGVFSSAQAATISLTPVSSEIGVGEKMTIEVRIDSEGESFNAAQVVIRFPKDTLEVTVLDKAESVFSFWLEEPQFSNTEGIVSFTGGAPFGVSGGAVEILKIEFLARGVGSDMLSFTEAAVTAADGSGTNILSKINDAIIAVIPQRIVPESQQKIPEPEQIIREPAPSEKLPSKPVLKIPLYPEKTSWYNLVAQFTASWDLPLDISGVNTALNKNPSSIPSGQTKGLFDNETFGILQDGIWYLHVRFKNNLAWGPTAHYRLAIDTSPPLGFELTVIEGEATDNPTPTLQFKTSDALSGLKEYQVRIGDGDLIKIPTADFSGAFTLPLQPPGERRVVVKAVDEAGNIVEDDIILETIPIASPTIVFVTEELFSDEEGGLIIKGTALPDINVLLAVLREGALVANSVTRSDEKGNWEFAFDQPFKNGRYILTVQSQDERGALSLVVESSEVRVKSKPIIQIGFIQLGKGGAALLLLFILLAGFGGGVWFYKKRQEKLALRISVVKTDMAKAFKLIQDDIEKLQKAIETPTEADDEFMKKRLRENIKKMEGYLKKEIEKLE